MSKSFQPDWISPPGNTIADILGERKIAVRLFAERMNFSLSEATRLITGASIITQDTAEKLADCLGASRDFWIKRERHYREEIIRFEKKAQDDWVSSLPIKDMIRFGCISNQNDRLAECLHFFDISSIESWKQRYSKELSTVNFRTSEAFDNQPAAVATWIRMGEIQASKIHCEPWDAKAFTEALTKIRFLTRQKDPQVFIPKLIEICSACGVAVAIARTPTGCSASGATKFINTNQALLLLSFRHLSDDQFWFTFFHEAGHLLLHGKEAVFIEEKQTDLWDEREKEANEFSAEVLIPNAYRYELSRIPLSKRGIVSFSMKVGVSPGIVIGQMQFYGRIKFNQLNSYKRRYKWE